MDVRLDGYRFEQGKPTAFLVGNGFWICAASKPTLNWKTIMAKISEMLPSSYLKQTDFDESGLIVTVASITQKNVAREDEPPEMKWLVFFTEFEKAMVLNTTNINALAKACGSDDTDDWAGKEVIVYVDPTVGYGGKTTGGLRIRKYVVAAPPKQAAKVQPRQMAPVAADEESPPF